MPTVAAASDLESLLCRRFGRRHAVLANRGTAALAAALHALERPGQAALFPAAMCSVPVFAAAFAGWVPEFADVNLRDANLNLEDVERALAQGGIGAVIPIHMLGKTDDVESLARLSHKYGADLVEDVALAMGSERDGRSAGSTGRIACFSFVRKMLPLEMGGAVLTDETALAERARAFLAALPPYNPAEREETSLALRAFHAATALAAAGDWRDLSTLAPFDNVFQRLLLRSTSESDWTPSVAAVELERLDQIIAARRTRAEVYETTFHHSALRPLDTRGSSLFAYPVRLVGHSAENFLEFAAAQGLQFKRIAYPDVHQIFGSRRRFPNAELLEEELIGLPLDDNQPVSAFWEYAADFQSAFEDFSRIPRRIFHRPGRLAARMARA